MKKITTLITFISITLSLSSVADVSIQQTLEEIAAAEHRSTENIARNQYRHPAETLSWLGIKPDMTVVEIWPGRGGWYTEILAPFLRDQGTLYTAAYDLESPVEYFRKTTQAYNKKLTARPDVYDKVIVTVLDFPEKTAIAPEASADMVLTFRSLHNMVRYDSEEQFFKVAYKTLKPGGILGLITHRGKPEMIGKEWAALGYVPQSEAIKMAEKAGFKLTDSSEINANPKDTKDYENGVWTLPPSFRLGEVDREKYAAIGESDRMTLKFIKPE